VHDEDSQVRAASIELDLVRELLGTSGSMRVAGWLCAFVAVVPLTVADAEPRRTLESVTLRKKPGEREPAVAQLAARTPVTVLGLEGRWLRVRVNSVEGYLTRTQVSDPDAPGVARTGQWSAPRMAGGKVRSELFIQVVAAKGALRAEPRTDARPVAELARGERLAVIDAASDPAWIRARAPAGDDGWIARDQIDNGAASVTVTGVDLQGLSQPHGERGASAAAPLSTRAELAIGFRTLGMALTSNAEGGLSNYVLDADAVAATLDVDVTRRLARVFVAGDARVSASDSSPGIDYPGPTAPAGKIPFRTVASDVGVRLGTRVRNVFDVALRAGGHYDAFLASSVRNAGMLPRERLFGATLGARIDIVPDRSRFTVTVRVDALVVGARAQTAGLEDGTSSTARALWGGATMRYALWPRIAVFGGFDFSRASTEWSGMSARQPGVTRAQRIDTAQLVQIGISASL
jgi:SH3-like domain-containing protein